MESLKYPKGWVKKGSAGFGLSTNQTISVAETSLNVFETQLFNNSNNITKTSSTAVTLKPNVKYKITFCGSTGSFSANGSTYFRIYNNTTSSYIDSFVGETVTLTYSTSNYGTPLPVTMTEFTPSVETSISIKPTSSGFTLRGNTYYNTWCYIEEIEAYIIPVPKALDMMVGVNQTWQSVSRTLGIAYTNSTGKPIIVNCIVASTGAGTINATVGGILMYGSGNSTSGQNLFISFVVPNGTSYTINTGAYTLNGWWELR